MYIVELSDIQICLALAAIVVWQPTCRKIAPQVAEIGKESGVSSYRIMLNSTLTEF